MNFIFDAGAVLLATIRDILPILLLIIGFQLFVLRQPIPQLRRLIVGGIYVVIGLAMFLIGLEKALFPVGKIMAAQLADPTLLGGGNIELVDWTAYGWVYLFAALIGFSTTIAEPSLLAVAIKAGEVSSGVISPWGLRITVAIGVAIGIALGTFRIVTGTPLHFYIIIGYIVIVLQTFITPKKMIALAYDSGGVTTSTVTVPLVAALGLGLSDAVPGRNPAIDGFGLIAFASLFPIITVMGYAQISLWFVNNSLKKRSKGENK
ncbi:MAG: PTS system mannose-specific, factor IIC [Candidatus Magnetoglobus multicellularis str. Araruama]|uniref:PTS system mannose-specific, factor IIC n=1 Tax=Candidatus Magnetoglobus multicellularis str. Araruama TaxID=890399 RepID=A0A1V1P3M0_9BACT|nr:MAG: PTS system mannose-specific, factor IIC [Candidatus Magnetoglobus multicellularis str. Araruama]